MFQNPYLMNNYQMNQYSQYSQPTSLTRVTGIEGAKAYQMPANSTVALFDNDNDLMYIKSTDGAGFPTIRMFKFTEMSPTQMSGTSENFVSREEFEQLRMEVQNIGKQFIPAEQRAAEPDSDRDGYGQGQGPETGLSGGVSAKKR